MSCLEINSKCLMCQNIVQELHNSNSSWISETFSAWDKSCATSLCQLFNLETDPFQNLFLEAGYCSSCHLLIKEVDFTVRSLNCLQRTLNKTRNNLEALLRENYYKIKSSGDGIKEEPIDPDFINFASSSWAKSYSSTVKFIFETVAGSTENISIAKPASLVSIPKKRKSRKPPVVSVVYAGEERNSVNYDKLTSGSTRLKRSSTIPMYSYAEASDTEEPEPDHVDNDDSDFKPEVEAILSDENKDFDLDPEEDSNKSEPEANSDSDHSDWEVSNFPKKRLTASATTNNPAENSKRKRSKPNLTGVINKNLSNKSKFNCTFDPKCTFSTRAPIKLQAHINRVHKGDKRPFHCETCKEASKDYAFGSATSYYYHQKKHHPTSEPTIFCDICKKSFIAKWELTKHKAVAHAEINYKLRCFHCKKMFDEDKPDELKKHEELHKLRDKPFACVLCDKEDYTNTHDLSIHVGQEHEEIAFKCETCNRAFNTRKKLKRHIVATHLERNPALQCQQCPFRALCPSALTRHVDWHSSQRNYQCDMCPNRYKSQSCLNYHMRVTHGKDRAYKCNLCGKSFGASSQLKAHEESHNTVKSYYCEICGKAFMGKKYLGQHMRGHAGKLKKYKQNKSSRIRKPATTTTTAGLTTTSSRSVASDAMSVEGDAEMEPEVPVPLPPRPAHQNSRFSAGEDNAGVSNLQFRTHLRHPVEHTIAPGGLPVNLMSNWNNSEHHSYLRLSNNAVHQEQQHPSSLDLSQGAQFLSVLHQQHHAHAMANNYFSSMH